MESIGKHNYEAFLLDYIEGNLGEAATTALFAFLEKHPELKPDLEGFDIIPATISTEPEQLSLEDKRLLKHIPEEIEEKIIAYLEGQLSAKEKAEFELELPQNEFMQQTLAAYRKTYLAAGDESYTAKAQLKRTTVAEEIIVAYMEGQLGPAERSEFEKVLATDEVVQNILNAYKQTRIEADASVVFPDKDSLKREAKVVRLYAYRNVLAVAASVVLLFGLFWLMNLNPGQSTQTAGIALKKSKLQKKNSNGSLDTQGSQMASNPGVNTAVKQPGPPKQDGLIQPENNNTPQQIANNNTTPADTSKNKPLPDLNKPAVELRSLIVLNPYKENDMDSMGSQPATRPRFGSSAYVAGQINKAAWGEDEENTEASPEKKKVKGFDVLALIGKGLRKLGNQRADAKKLEDQEKDYTEYVVTIGSLSVTRKVAD